MASQIVRCFRAPKVKKREASVASPDVALFLRGDSQSHESCCVAWSGSGDFLFEGDKTSGLTAEAARCAHDGFFCCAELEDILMSLVLSEWPHSCSRSQRRSAIKHSIGLCVCSLSRKGDSSALNFFDMGSRRMAELESVFFLK